MISVDFSDKLKKITTDSGKFLSKTVIIATGANPRSLGLSEEAELIGRGVHYCAHCDGRFYKDKTVCVIGGGNSAAEDSLYLAKLCKKVYLIHRRDELRAAKVYHSQIFETVNIEPVWDSVVEKIISGDKVTGVSIRNIKTGEMSDIELNGVFVSIGRNPESEMFKGQLEIDSFGYIVADETTKTNIHGVFAAGDVRTKPLRQVVTAASDGAVSAFFAEVYINENK